MLTSRTLSRQNTNSRNNNNCHTVLLQNFSLKSYTNSCLPFDAFLMPEKNLIALPLNALPLLIRFVFVFAVFFFLSTTVFSLHTYISDRLIFFFRLRCCCSSLLWCSIFHSFNAHNEHTLHTFSSINIHKNTVCLL